MFRFEVMIQKADTSSLVGGAGARPPANLTSKGYATAADKAADSTFTYWKPAQTNIGRAVSHHSNVAIALSLTPKRATAADGRPFKGAL